MEGEGHDVADYAGILIHKSRIVELYGINRGVQRNDLHTGKVNFYEERSKIWPTLLCTKIHIHIIED